MIFLKFKYAFIFVFFALFFSSTSYSSASIAADLNNENLWLLIEREKGTNGVTSSYYFLKPDLIIEKERYQDDKQTADYMRIFIVVEGQKYWGVSHYRIKFEPQKQLSLYKLSFITPDGKVVRATSLPESAIEWITPPEKISYLSKAYDIAYSWITDTENDNHED
jgi:hypothetical protein